jgi:hypothetical protein
MTDDKNTQDTDPAKDTQTTDSYEERYKELQSTMTKTSQENATLKAEIEKDKSLINDLTPFIDYDKMNGKVADPEDGDALVDNKTLTKKIQGLQDEILRTKYTSDFRSKYPDMIEHEDLVGLYLNKTNPRDTIENRMLKAVENTRALLKSEQSKGREKYEQEVKTKTTEEAKVAGFAGGSEPHEGDGAHKAETYEEYIQSRKNDSAKAQGLI